MTANLSQKGWKIISDSFKCVFVAFIIVIHLEQNTSKQPGLNFVRINRKLNSLSLSLFVDINLRRLWPLTVPPLPHDINDLKDRIPRAGATTERQMLQSVEQEI